MSVGKNVAAILGAWFALFVLSGCSATVGSLPTESAPMQIEDPAERYLLEPGNRVRVIVFNETGLSGDFTVDPLGNISMPLVGSIAASGVTSKALAGRIETALKDGRFLLDPNVAVEIQTFRPFYVLGEVRSPGEFAYSYGMTVLSAIARAGGYDYRASQGTVLLVRGMGAEEKDYAAGERAPILPGDIIKVLERRF